MATENFSLLLKITFSHVGVSMQDNSNETWQLVDSVKLFAAEGSSGGGKKENPMEKKIKGEEDTDNKNSKDNPKEPTNKSIADPDTNLTGDTGNLNEGQTDLGASGTGTENI